MLCHQRCVGRTSALSLIPPRLAAQYFFLDGKLVTKLTDNAPIAATEGARARALYLVPRSHESIDV